MRVLRELGRQVAEIAALPAQRQTIDLWKQLNALRSTRPMVMIDQIPWHEMNVDDELTLRTIDPASQALETELRRRLYRWRHLRGDSVIEARMPVAPALSDTGFGLAIEEDRAVTDSQNDVVGHSYHDQLATSEDLLKIQRPHIQYDVAETARRVDRLRELFDGILDVEVAGELPMFNIWDLIVMWRGAEAVLMDLGDRPEHLHQLMARATDAYVARVEQWEALGLLTKHNDWVHCTGAFTDQLPASGYDPAKPRMCDIWACGMAQIFSSVSPAMHQEFELDYLNPVYARFGHVYYGCCEPLEGKMHLVRKIPHVRKISMSPWVNQAAGAEAIGRDFVFSRKPSPAFLAVDHWDPKAVDRDLRETVATCKRYGCPLELILKDISTTRYQPQRIWEWADIAMKVVGEES
jgi:hypothetical protein